MLSSQQKKMPEDAQKPYLNAILSNPPAQVVVFFLLARVVCIQNNVAIPAVKFANIFLWHWRLGTTIDSPHLKSDSNQ